MANRINPKVIWAAVLIIISTILITNGGMRNYRKKRRELKKLKEQVSGLKHEFEFKKNLLSTTAEDPFYLELLAREKLGLIKPDELEYRFIPEEDRKESSEEGLADTAR